MDFHPSSQKRKSHIEIGKIYFWTATINNWQPLLQKDAYKKVVIGSLEYLSNAGNIDVFSFVVMPTHIHLIWRINKNNGKETAQGSFLKFTAHEFKKLLIRTSEGVAFQSDKLLPYKVKASNKNYEFWQRDSLAVPLYTSKVAYQKLNYIHNNPLAKHWHLANDICDYRYSTARFYEMGVVDFSFIKDLREEFEYWV